MRLIEIIKNDLENEHLRLEEQLEFYINQTTHIDEKVSNIRKVLEKLAIIEMAKSKFNIYLNDKSE